MTNTDNLKNAITQLYLGDVLTHTEYTRLNKKLDRSEAKRAQAELVQGTANAILAMLDSADFEGDYFSVKKTSNSVGFMDFIETDRSTVLKALKLLVSQDQLRKTGLVGGVEKPVSEVNAFQIRYTRV